MICVILCGGSGSRLWPLSRDMQPKPFFRLPDGKNLIQHAIEAASQMPDVKEILIVTNEMLRANILGEVHGMHESTPIRYIFEPLGRNTAAAVFTASLDISRRYGGDEPMQIFTADHLIEDVRALGNAVASALKLACNENKLVTFGIKPTRPETEYGYIHYQGDTVLEFVEKPTIEVAKTYVESGEYLWNSGMFCFKAGTIRDEMEKYAPKIAHTAEMCFNTSILKSTGNEVHLNDQLFQLVPSVSIDYAVMEKSDNIAVVAADIGWNDIGSWLSVCELYPSGMDNNRVIGECDPFFVGSKNCTIHASGKVVAVIGMKDTLVADTGDALLVTPFSKSRHVRQVYEALKARKHETSVFHLTATPPWGEFAVLYSGKGYKVKRLRIKPGESISLQSHQQRNETWTMVQGEGIVYRNDETIPVKPGDTVFIPKEAKHSVECTSKEPLEIVEVQMGDYLGEDDITRYKDAYGREGEGAQQEQEQTETQNK